MYLDWNATAPLLPAARVAMIEALDGAWANPSSPHGAGRRAAAVLDRARERVGELVSWDPRGVIFTSGASEANALALAGGLRALRLVSAVEHPSVHAWGDEVIPVDARGVIDLDALDRALDGRGGEAVVSVMAANNETGVLQPLQDIRDVCRRRGALFHCDATQLPGRLPVAVDADALTLSSHKLGGPRGAGALVVRPHVAAMLSPQIRGGPQERGLRGGTENIAAIAGFGAAAAAAGVASPVARDQLEDACRAHGAEILGEGAPRLPNTVCALFPHPGDVIVMALDLEGVAVSTGSACSSGSAAASHVLAAMGRSGIPVRFSTGPEPLDVTPALDALGRVMERMEGACVS